MSAELDTLAKYIRSLFLEIDQLANASNDIAASYVSDDEELDDEDHPVAKLQQSEYQIRRTVDSLVKTLSSNYILDPYFRRALQKLAMMDAIKDGKTRFVDFVNKNIKD